MKTIIAVYILIMLCFTPFIYYNNAHDYRPGSTAQRWSSAFGQSFYWPSYAFSAEPEVDSSNIESFQQSMIEILNYRNDKMFTGQRNRDHGQMLFRALGNCLTSAGAEQSNVLNLYQEIFSGNQSGKELERIRSSVMGQMDGYDFADIIEAGEECGLDLQSKLKNATLSAVSDEVVQSMTDVSEEGESDSLVTGTMQNYVEGSSGEDIEGIYEKEANETWQSMQSSPLEFLRTCKKQGVNYAVDILQLSPEEAAVEAEQECATQLEQFRNCMGGESSNTRDCYEIVFGYGD